MAPAFPRPIRVMLSMALVSCLGSGLTYPFLLVYLHDVRHISLGSTGLLMALPAVFGLVATPLTGSLVDGVGARAVLFWSALAAATGSALLPAISSAPSAIAPLALYGLGTVGIATAINTLFAQLIHDPVLQTRAFSLNFMFVNLGLAAGALIAAEIVAVRRPGTFSLIYLLDAASFVVAAVGSVTLPRRTRLAGTKARVRSRPSANAYRMVLANRIFLRYVMLLGAIFLVGYGALDAGFVGYSVTSVRISPSLVADCFVVNFVVIICLQQVASRFVERIPRSFALAIASSAFALAWLAEWTAGRFPGSMTSKVLVISFGAIFALGEMALSPVRNVLVNALATEELRGRYNAVSLSVIQSANIVAPAVIGILLGASLGGPLVLALVILSALDVLASFQLGTRLSPAQDNRPGIALTVRVGRGRRHHHAAAREPEANPAPAPGPLSR